MVAPGDIALFRVGAFGFGALFVLLDKESFPLFAHVRPRRLNVQGQPALARRKDGPHLHGSTSQEAHLVGQTDPHKRAAGTLGAVVQGRRHDTRGCIPFELLDGRERPRDEPFVQGNPHPLFRCGEIEHPLTAAKAGLIACSVCHLLCPAAPPKPTAGAAKCPRCGAALHSRKPDSIARTWALVIAACIFYIPANVLPMTTVTSLGQVQSDTIMSGVIYFVQTGMWPIALVIFIASIFVPVLKLLMLLFLVISVQHRSTWRPKDRTRLYRITEAIGRWSMTDIFVVTILVALVHLGALANIEAQAGAVFFAAVVVITMLAAMSFDPRLIWDAKETTDE